MVKAMKQKIDALTFSTVMNCDTKTGFVFREYDNTHCEGTLQREFKAKWGQCTLGPDGKSYVILNYPGAADNSFMGFFGL